MEPRKEINYDLQRELVEIMIEKHHSREHDRQLKERDRELEKNIERMEAYRAETVELIKTDLVEKFDALLAGSRLPDDEKTSLRQMRMDSLDEDAEKLTRYYETHSPPSRGENKKE